MNGYNIFSGTMKELQPILEKYECIFIYQHLKNGKMIYVIGAKDFKSSNSLSDNHT